MIKNNYEDIAPYYDELFSISEAEKGFISLLNLNKNDNILDIGCGTGNLTYYLSGITDNVLGIDPDHGMIQKAISKRVNESAKFLEKGMMDIESLDTPSPFDYIFVMGNTLVHLESYNQFESFFRLCHNTMNDKGKLIIQNLNYDRILQNKLYSLKTIENSRICFRRGYTEDNNHLIFNRTILLKESSKVIKSSVKIYPLVHDEIVEMIKPYFIIENHFGTFSGDLFKKAESELSIYILEKIL